MIEKKLTRDEEADEIIRRLKGDFDLEIGIRYISRRFALRTYLGLTEEEIDRFEKEFN